MATEAGIPGEPETEATETEAQTTDQPSEPTTPETEQPKFNKESLLADLKGERDRRKALTEKVESLTTELTSLKESKASAATLAADHKALQAKYSRLESFLSAAGGPISQALDSRSFTKDLFESDTDVAELVTKWNKSHPSATSSALSNAASAGKSSTSINDLLRAAARGGQ